MPRVDALGARIEIMEVTALQFHRADGQPHRPVVEQIPIHQRIKRRGERGAVVEAQRAGRAGGGEGGRQHPRQEETGHTRRRHPAGGPQMHRFAHMLAEPGCEAWQAAGRAVPERTQPLHPPPGRVPGNDRGVDRADRDAGDPVYLDRGGGQRLVDAGLVGAERTPALQHQRHLIGQRQCGAAGGFDIGHGAYLPLMLRCIKRDIAGDQAPRAAQAAIAPACSTRRRAR